MIRKIIDENILEQFIAKFISLSMTSKA